jgi:carbonic anhydrase/acetyltransferase-like protein (isoleucine patch superfamily)
MTKSSAIKYKITKDIMTVEGHTLHRIKAARAFGAIAVGTRGGWIERPDNLSQDGDCWIADEARAYGDAAVRDNAQLRDSAEARDRAEIGDEAIIEAHGLACDNSVLTDHCRLAGWAEARHGARLSQNAVVQGNAVIENTTISGNAVISGDTQINDQAPIVDAKIGGRDEPQMPPRRTAIFARCQDDGGWQWDKITPILELHHGHVMPAQAAALAAAHPDYRVSVVELPSDTAQETRIALRREGFVLSPRELFRLDSPAEIEPPAPAKRKKAKPARRAAQRRRDNAQADAAD